MSEKQKPNIRKNIHIDQAGKGVFIYVIRYRGDDHVSTHCYSAYPWNHNLSGRNPGFIARRIKRGLRLLNASLKREWGQS